jgi:hypothetical protein
VENAVTTLTTFLDIFVAVANESNGFHPTK